jgi:uncharacterized protein
VKRWILILFALLVLAVPACAKALPLVVDDAGLLTQESFAGLTAEAERLSEVYSMDVVILTTGSLGGKTALDYAADYYDTNGYGQGVAHDGVMLLLSIEDRDWCILTTGSGVAAFTDYGIDAVSEDIVPYFSNGDYPGGFARFLRDAQIMLEQAKNGAPFDVRNPVQLRTAMERTTGIAIYLFIASLLVAIVGLLILMRGMKTARPQHAAGRYAIDGSMRISRAQDIYLYHTQTRVRVPKSESSGSGGGSSTFRSSSGSSHGGKSGKF